MMVKDTAGFTQEEVFLSRRKISTTHLHYETYEESSQSWVLEALDPFETLDSCVKLTAVSLHGAACSAPIFAPIQWAKKAGGQG